MDAAALWATALVLGALHTLEPDHVAAVSAFLVRRPRPRDALGYGLSWALGHGGMVLVAGTAVVALGLHVPAATGAWLERLVGATLVGLGLWVAVGARRIHAHTHVHDDGTVHSHLHAHPPAEGRVAGGAHGRRVHGHRHAATAVGALHGLAGTAPAVALLPLAEGASPMAAAGYLAAFGVGTAVSMALYAMFAGRLASRAAARSGALGRALARAAGVGTVLVGIVWLVR